MRVHGARRSAHRVAAAIEMARSRAPPGATGTVAVGGLWQASTAGGILPMWRPDGTELYYLSPAGEMMATPITVVGDTLEPGAPVVLFPTHIVGGGVDAQQGHTDAP